jgi:hypothetical protein
MSIFRKERPVDSQRTLNAYLDRERGHIPARLYALEALSVIDPDSSVAEVIQEDEVVVRGHLIRQNIEGRPLVQFLPAGNEDQQERWGITIYPDQHLPLRGLAIVVMSRHEISPPAGH